MTSIDRAVGWLLALAVATAWPTLDSPVAAAEHRQRLTDGWEHYRGTLGSVWEVWRGDKASDNVTWANVMLPHCFNARDAGLIPSDLSDFNRYASLYRHVYLLHVPAVSLERVHVLPELAAGQGNAVVRGRLQNPEQVTTELAIVIEVRDLASAVVHRRELKAAPSEGDKKLDSFTIPAPATWSPATPRLYSCSVTLASRHGEHRVDERCGLRSVEWVPHGPFKLNGLAHTLDPSRKTAIRRCDFCKDVVDVYSLSIWDGRYSGRYREYRGAAKKAIANTPHFFHAEWGGDSHAGRFDNDPEQMLEKVAEGQGTAEVGKAYKASGGKVRMSKDGDCSKSTMVNLFDWHLHEQEQMPNLTGAAAWILKNFSTPLRPENPVPRVNQKGVVTRDGTPKESYYVFQSYWAEKPMVQLANGRARIHFRLTGRKAVAAVTSSGLRSAFVTLDAEPAAGKAATTATQASPVGSSRPPASEAIDVAGLDRERILKAADAALALPPLTITAHRAPHAEGSANDFYSNGDYWWPDPTKPDGLPYVRRDGESNPDNFFAHRQAVNTLRDRVAALAAARLVTGDARYAAKADELLRVFFLDPATRMNPNLAHAQAVPGVSAGRPAGIIDGLHLAEVARAVKVLAQERALTEATVTGVKRWFTDLSSWMTTSVNGRKEAAAKNNHAVAYFVQLAAFADLTGDEPLLAECRRQFKEVFVPHQMAADGSFPEELGRTKPYGYSIFQLDQMATLCQILSTPADDLWSFELPDGRGMRRAVGWLRPYLADKTSWPKPPDVEHWEGWPVRQPHLLFAGLALREPAFLDLWKRLPPEPTDPEVRRNVPITQPLLWLRE